MQLRLLQLFLLLCLPFSLLAQEINRRDSEKLADTEAQDQSSVKRPTDDAIDVNFLFSYYDQDGNHSAVTGGFGTERLRDYASKIIINVPLDPLSRLTVSTGLNYYTSASTDNINRNVSSASSDDYRAQLSFAYARSTPDKKQTWGFMAGGSVETDYISVSIGGNWSKESRDGNREVGVTAQVFFDTWMIIFPDELRQIGDELVTNDKRQSYYLSLSYSQVLTKRLQAFFTTEVVFQRGLLSTPFHRAFFSDTLIPRVEKLPDHRIKTPIGVRLNYFLADAIVFRLFYRYYFDSFGIHANTFSLEMPLKLNNYFSLYPFYRFHSQTQADYFEEFRGHSPDATYYTSDFDLSGFHSRKIGFGLRYSPLYGIARFKTPFSKKVTQFKSLDVRYANYHREDGLGATVISANLSFTIF
ncbi:MAG: DUF3570 domain-containing protein [bacterium]